MFRDYRKKILESPISVLLPVSGLIILGLATLFSITSTQGQAPPNALSKQIICNYNVHDTAHTQANHPQIYLYNIWVHYHCGNHPIFRRKNSGCISMDKYWTPFWIAAFRNCQMGYCDCTRSIFIRP